MKLIENSIEINRSPSEVLDYVARPARWHEWFPSSRPADIENRVMIKGDSFSVITVQKPLMGLLPAVQKNIKWTVLDYKDATAWRIASTSSSIDVETEYHLSPTKNGTLFKRSFRYSAKGLLRIIEPIALRRELKLSAAQALFNVKESLERKELLERDAKSH